MFCIVCLEVMMENLWKFNDVVEKCVDNYI